MNSSNIADQLIAQGFGAKIKEALAHYFGIEESSVKVENDVISPKHTLIILTPIDASKPKIKLRLTELERHQGAQILTQTDDTVEFRIGDDTIVELTQGILAKKK